MPKPHDWIMRLAAACIAFAGAQAAAQPVAPNIAGSWSFETPVSTPNRCVISGNATIAGAPAPGEYDIALTGTEVCENGETWRTVQRCRAVQTLRVVRIACEIVSAEPSNYAPDNFVLQIENDSLMTGDLLSSWNTTARWVRGGPGLIS